MTAGVQYPTLHEVHRLSLAQGLGRRGDCLFYFYFYFYSSLILQACAAPHGYDAMVPRFWFGASWREIYSNVCAQDTQLVGCIRFMATNGIVLEICFRIQQPFIG